MSSLELDGRPTSYSDWPGSEGLTLSCKVLAKDCDPTRLREECTTGWPRSCHALGRLPASGDRRLLDRAFSLARRGCQAGILDECELLSTGDEPSDDDKLFAETRLCWLKGKCFQLGSHYLYVRGDRVKARDAYELDCQTHGASCSILAEDYLRGELPEPAPHRGRDLLRYTCANWSDGCELLSPGQDARPTSANP